MDSGVFLRRELKWRRFCSLSGEQVGDEYMHSASKMNKAVVVFMKRANLVGRPILLVECL